MRPPEASCLLLACADDRSNISRALSGAGMVEERGALPEVGASGDTWENLFSWPLVMGQRWKERGLC